jgi:Flp pilus assembly protein TadG
MRMNGRRTWSRGQSVVEFSFTVAILMLLVVLSAQIAIYLHYRNSLELAAREGAFEAALAGHSLQDGERTTLELWAKLEPGGGRITVQAVRSGNLVFVTAKGTAPAILPVPIPPFNAWPLSSRAVHTIEVFEPGSGP